MHNPRCILNAYCVNPSIYLLALNHPMQQRISCNIETLLKMHTNTYSCKNGVWLKRITCTELLCLSVILANAAKNGCIHIINFTCSAKDFLRCVFVPLTWHTTACSNINEFIRSSHDIVPNHFNWWQSFLSMSVQKFWNEKPGKLYRRRFVAIKFLRKCSHTMNQLNWLRFPWKNNWRCYSMCTDRFMYAVFFCNRFH